MSKVRVNYKSDLPPIAVTFNLNGEPIAVPNHDFALRFFVEGAPGVSFMCGYSKKNEEYSHCEKTDDNTITCYIDNHKFGCGRLCLEYIDFNPNIKYEDGIKKTVTPSRLNIVLVEGAGDSTASAAAGVDIDIHDAIVALQNDIGEINETLDGKLSFYSVDWIDNSEEYTEENYNALHEAVSANTFVLYKMTPCIAMIYGDHAVRMRFVRYKNCKFVQVTLVNGEVTVDWIENEHLATTEDLESYYTKTEADSLLSNKVDSTELSNQSNIASRGANRVGYYNSVTGGKTVAGMFDWLLENNKRYHAAMWLENDRTATHWDAMSSAIDDEKSIFRGSVPAIDVSKSSNEITVSFPTATGIDTYVATKSGSTVTVVKTTKTFLFAASPSQQL